jgi:uncharacterized protein YndB with AHSA1/START domain
MTVVDKTPPAQSEFIAFELELAHAPAKVWRALTDPALLTEWLLPVVDQQLTLAAGSSFALKTEPKPGWDGRVDCRLIEVDPHRAISYSWVAGDMELDTVVTFTLTPTESGTRLTLVQSGFKPSQKQASGGARYGWRLMSGRLVDLLGRIS